MRQNDKAGCGLLNTVGRRSGEYVTDGNNLKLAGSIYSYDEVGRIKTNSQCTPQNCPSNTLFSIGYTYDLAGNVRTAGNGQGVTLTYGYDASGHLNALTSSLSNTNHPATLFNNAIYGPMGLTQVSLGNGFAEVRGYHQRGWLQSQQDGPATTTPATAGTGLVTVNGTLQSTQVQTQPATQATGSVTIAGYEQSAWIPDPQGACNPECGQMIQVFDYGRVIIAVNGYGKTVYYGYGDGSDSVAWNIAQAFQSDPSSPVDSWSSGSVVYFRARPYGTGPNGWPISCSSYSDDPDFGYYPSFYSSSCGPNLNGGQDAA